MSTSKLQRYTSEQLYKRFGKYGLVENTRPHWLISSKGERLELDFFIDKLSIAIEVQGTQHIEFTPLFHATEYDFTEQLRRDREKKDLCNKTNIHLLYIHYKQDVFDCITTIYQILRIATETTTEEWTFPEKPMQFTPVRYRQWRDAENCRKNRAKRAERKKCKKRKSELGSARARSKGRKLIARQVEPGKYIAWGGSSTHHVLFTNPADINSYTCDCSGQKKAKDNICSHVWATYSKQQGHPPKPV